MEDKDKELTGKEAILEQEAANAAIYSINAHDQQRSIEAVAENEAHLTTGDIGSDTSPIHGDARDAAQGKAASSIERYEDAMNDKAHVDARYLDPQVAKTGPGSETSVETDAQPELAEGAKEELGGVIGALGAIAGIQSAKPDAKAADGQGETLSPDKNPSLFGSGDIAKQARDMKNANWQDPSLVDREQHKDKK